MSAKKTNNRPQQKPTPKLKDTPQLDTPELEKKRNPFYWYLIPVLIFATVAIYYQSLDNELTNWDDKGYVTDNMHIRSMHGDSTSITFNALFDTTQYGIEMGNYHPLTMVSYAMDYNKDGLNPRPYHTTNLILHVMNVLLVFGFIWLLTKQQWVSFVTAAVFALHPMHVESVAWVAERKDVLFSFFYLIALCTYVLYVKRQGAGKWLFYLVGLAACLLALFSKGMAVSLPVAFFAVDFFLRRKLSLGLIVEKIPYFIAAIIFGLIAIEAQRKFNAVGDSGKYDGTERFLFTCYGTMLYLWKFIAPFNLSCFYKYPTRDENGLFPAIVYFSPFFIGGICFWIIRSLRKSRDVAFGFGFFLVTIALVLQVLPVGEAIIAERYTYLPYIGIAFILGRALQNLWDNHSEKVKSWKVPATLTTAVLIIFFATTAFQRTKVWKDSVTLWNDAIAKDDSVPRQYQSRGDAYETLGEAAKKENNISLAVQHYQTAVNNYDKALKITPIYPDALYNRGIAYYYLASMDTVATTRNQEFLQALHDYDLAIKYNPNIHNCFYNRGITYHSLNRFAEAIADYKEALKRWPGQAMIYNNMGLAYFFANDYKNAFDAYSEALKINPRYAEVYNNRAGISYKQGDYAAALSDMENAVKYGYTGFDPKFIEGLRNAVKNGTKM